MDDKHFYRTVVVAEVLSEYQPSFKTLAQIHDAITEGDCSGNWEVQSQEEISPAKMARLLLAQGSDPSFFQLDEPMVCCVCGKRAEPEIGDTEPLCQCTCPECGVHCFDDSTLEGHGMCSACFAACALGTPFAPKQLGGNICGVEGSNPEVQANASLIANAPEGLQALVYALGVLESMPDHMREQLADILDEDIDLARINAAVNKMKGEA